MQNGKKKLPSNRPFWYYGILGFLISFVSQPLTSIVLGVSFTHNVIGSVPWFFSSLIIIGIADAVMKKVMPTDSDKLGGRALLENIILAMMSIIFTPLFVIMMTAPNILILMEIISIHPRIIIGGVGAILLSILYLIYDRLIGSIF